MLYAQLLFGFVVVFFLSMIILDYRKYSSVSYALSLNIRPFLSLMFLIGIGLVFWGVLDQQGFKQFFEIY